jgi:hypothetical protein
VKQSRTLNVTPLTILLSLLNGFANGMVPVFDASRESTFDSRDAMLAQPLAPER